MSDVGDAATGTLEELKTCFDRVIAFMLVTTATIALAQDTRPRHRAIRPGQPQGRHEGAVQGSGGRRCRPPSGQIAYAQNAQEERIVAGMADTAQALATLRRAAVEKFGAEGARPLIGDPAAKSAENMARIDMAKATVTEDIAIVDAGDGRDPADRLTLRRVVGKWRVPVSEMLKDVAPDAIDQKLDEMATQRKVITQAAADISTGKYKTAEEAGDALARAMKQPPATTRAATRATTAPATQSTR